MNKKIYFFITCLVLNFIVLISSCVINQPSTVEINTPSLNFNEKLAFKKYDVEERFEVNSCLIKSINVFADKPDGINTRSVNANIFYNGSSNISFLSQYQSMGSRGTKVYSSENYHDQLNFPFILDKELSISGQGPVEFYDYGGSLNTHPCSAGSANVNGSINLIDKKAYFDVLTNATDCNGKKVDFSFSTKNSTVSYSNYILKLNPNENGFSVQVDGSIIDNELIDSFAWKLKVKLYNPPGACSQSGSFEDIITNVGNYNYTFPDEAPNGVYLAELSYVQCIEETYTAKAFKTKGTESIAPHLSIEKQSYNTVNLTTDSKDNWDLYYKKPDSDSFSKIRNCLSPKEKANVHLTGKGTHVFVAKLSKDPRKVSNEASINLSDIIIIPSQTPFPDPGIGAGSGGGNGNGDGNPSPSPNVSPSLPPTPTPTPTPEIFKKQLIIKHIISLENKYNIQDENSFSTQSISADKNIIPDATANYNTNNEQMDLLKIGERVNRIVSLIPTYESFSAVSNLESMKRLLAHSLINTDIYKSSSDYEIANFIALRLSNLGSRAMNPSAYDNIKLETDACAYGIGASISLLEYISELPIADDAPANPAPRYDGYGLDINVEVMNQSGIRVKHWYVRDVRSFYLPWDGKIEGKDDYIPNGIYYLKIGIEPSKERGPQYYSVINRGVFSVSRFEVKNSCSNKSKYKLLIVPNDGTQEDLAAEIQRATNDYFAINILPSEDLPFSTAAKINSINYSKGGGNSKNNKNSKSEYDNCSKMINYTITYIQNRLKNSLPYKLGEGVPKIFTPILVNCAGDEEQPEIIRVVGSSDHTRPEIVRKKDNYPVALLKEYNDVISFGKTSVANLFILPEIKWYGSSRKLIQDTDSNLAGIPFVETGFYKFYCKVGILSPDYRAYKKYATEEVEFDFYVNNNFESYSTKPGGYKTPGDYNTNELKDNIKYHIRERHDINFMSAKQFLAVHAHLHDKLTASQTIDRLVRAKFNKAEDKKGICFNPNLALDKIFSNIEDVANMRNVNDSWQFNKLNYSFVHNYHFDPPLTNNTFINGTILSQNNSSKRIEARRDGHLISSIINYDGTNHYIATGYPNGNVPSSGYDDYLDLGEVTSYYRGLIEYNTLKPGNLVVKNNISAAANQIFIKSLIWANDGRATGALTNFAKAMIDDYDAKAKGIPNILKVAGIPNNKMPDLELILKMEDIIREINGIHYDY